MFRLKINRALELLAAKLVYELDLLSGKFRLINHMCPMCNSDAPEVDNCAICCSHHSASGDKWPTDGKIKEKWLKDYIMVLDCKLKLKKTLIDHKRN